MIDDALLDDEDGRRSLHQRSLHFMKIIAEGNNGEKNRQNTSQCHDALRSARAPRRIRPATGEVAEEKGVTRDGDDGPNEIEREFHQSQPILRARQRFMFGSPTPPSYIGESIPNEPEHSQKSHQIYGRHQLLLRLPSGKASCRERRGKLPPPRKY